MRNMYSWLFVGRSVQDSGIGLGLCQMISDRRYQPGSAISQPWDFTQQGQINRPFGNRPHFDLWPILAHPLHFSQGCCRAKASRHGWPIRSLGLRLITFVAVCTSYGLSLNGFPKLVPFPWPAAFPLPLYPSPIFSQNVPVSFSTRRTSLNTSVSLSMYSSIVGSRPICLSIRIAPHLPQISLCGSLLRSWS